MTTRGSALPSFLPLATRKGSTLHRSFSIVLPVPNAGKALAENVQHLCDVLSDLTDWFEVLLVDQGTSEHATDMAYALAVEYPQVRVVRMRSQPDSPAAGQTAIEHAQGEVVWFQRRHGKCRPSEIRRLWELRESANRGREFAGGSASDPRRRQELSETPVLADIRPVSRGAGSRVPQLEFRTLARPAEAASASTCTGARLE